MKPLTVGQVAKEAGVGIETLRFYEREGLLEPPKRREPSGYRQYSQDVIPRLVFIRRAKELGFSLPEIRELLYLRADPSVTCADIRHRAEVKIADISRRVDDLVKIRSALEEIASTCASAEPSGPCPLLEHLSNEDPDFFFRVKEEA